MEKSRSKRRSLNPRWLSRQMGLRKQDQAKRMNLQVNNSKLNPVECWIRAAMYICTCIDCPRLTPPGCPGRLCSPFSPLWPLARPVATDWTGTRAPCGSCLRWPPPRPREREWRRWKNKWTKIVLYILGGFYNERIPCPDAAVLDNRCFKKFTGYVNKVKVQTLYKCCLLGLFLRPLLNV